MKERAEVYHSDFFKEYPNYERYLYSIHNLSQIEIDRVKEVIGVFIRTFRPSGIVNGDIIGTTSDPNIYYKGLYIYINGSLYSDPNRRIDVLQNSEVHRYNLSHIRYARSINNYETMKGKGYPPDYWDGLPIMWLPYRGLHDIIVRNIGAFKRMYMSPDCTTCNMMNDILVTTFRDGSEWHFYYDGPCETLSGKQTQRMKYGYSLDPINHDHCDAPENTVFVVPGYF